MPIQVPVLGNVSYAELRDELVTAIPKHTREWTNFNPSDPGITLIELLTWVGEGLIYRCDQMPDRLFTDFLRLVAGCGWQDKPEVENDPELEELRDYLAQIADRKIEPNRTEMKALAQRFLTSSYRAVTAADFKKLALQAVESHPDYTIKRVEVFNLQDRVEIVLIGKSPPPESQIESIIQTVYEYLEPRRLIGTFLSVKLAEYTKLSLRIKFVCKSYATFKVEDVEATVRESVKSYLDSLNGGPEGTGWPYNRNLSVYELFYVVEKNSDVDHVVQITPFEDENPVVKINGLIALEALEVVGGI